MLGSASQASLVNVFVADKVRKKLTIGNKGAGETTALRAHGQSSAYRKEVVLHGCRGKRSGGTVTTLADNTLTMHGRPEADRISVRKHTHTHNNIGVSRDADCSRFYWLHPPMSTAGADVSYPATTLFDRQKLSG